MKNLIAFAVLLFPICGVAQELHILSRGRYEFRNTGCFANDTCSLIRVSFLTEGYVVAYPDGSPYYGKYLVAEYETDSIEALTDYVFVSFFRGCIYTTRLIDGLVVPTYDHVRYGKGDVFRFDDWVIDSIDDDPAYGSQGGMRYAGLKWNVVPGSYSRGSARYFSDSPPPSPVLYVTDFPSGGFFMNGSAQNSSLQLRMCLYRAADIPHKTDGKTLGSAAPIVCYEWENWFVYDHLRNEFKWPHQGEEFCPAEPFLPQ